MYDLFYKMGMTAYVLNSTTQETKVKRQPGVYHEILTQNQNFLKLLHRIL